jgi:hypothetical protein
MEEMPKVQPRTLISVGFPALTNYVILISTLTGIVEFILYLEAVIEISTVIMIISLTG